MMDHYFVSVNDGSKGFSKFMTKSEVKVALETVLHYDPTSAALLLLADDKMTDDMGRYVEWRKLR